MELPEYKTIIKLLQKGIAFHHAGMLPVFREMIELLFAKNYIKLLVATETFAVGINMPTKSVVFTSLKIIREIYVSANFIDNVFVIKLIHVIENGETVKTLFMKQ